MMVEQSFTLVLVMVTLFIRALTKSEEEQLRRERLEDRADAAQVPSGNVDVLRTGPS
jgi:hypothetical protein